MSRDARPANAVRRPVSADRPGGWDVTFESVFDQIRDARTGVDPRLANRQRCEDFETFRPLFEQIQKDLDAGVRETRRVYGEYRLTRQDIENTARFDDAVFLCGAPIEDHRAGKDGDEETEWFYVPGNGIYEIPYRTLVPKGQDSVWVAGRCFSATHDAHASCRSMGQTMTMGQVAGTAAALSLRENAGATTLDTEALREILLKDGVLLELDRQPAYTGVRDWHLNRKSS